MSRIEWVEEQLRRALLDGELKPGERLLTAQLAERFQVSPTPLREALHRFAGEGLVEFIPQRGARVASLSVSESRELIELRTLLEPACIAHAIANGTQEWRSEVAAAAVDVSSKLGGRTFEVAASENAYRDFYAALTSTCDSVRLHRYANSVRDQHARYRAATLPSIDRKALSDHVARIAEAALARRPKQAGTASCAELEAFAEAFEKSAPP